LSAATGQIGPNALLQLAPVLERHGGAALREAVFLAGGVRGPVRTDGLIPEGPVAGVHQALRRLVPGPAPALAREAGLGTAEYILAHRIPRAAQAVLRALPRGLSARLLARAIARNAWTFAGSGRFSEVSPGRRVQRGVSHPPNPPWDISERKMKEVAVFEIADNPLVRGEVSARPVCDWHVAVFERLFAVLVDARVEVRETACCACGDAACRFEIRRPAG
jgi:divinyl protochlorophyllide a 8-vinyl-reductase